MKPVLTSLRAFLLAWSLLLTTQVALVHGYAHQQQQQQAQSGASRNATDTEKIASEQLCNFCLSLSQLGAALPSQNQLAATRHATPDFQSGPSVSLATVLAAAPQARGPPAQS